MSEEFIIWWSPVAFPNGTDTVKADSREHAVEMALERMREFSQCGAYGAEPMEDKEDKMYSTDSAEHGNAFASGIKGVAKAYSRGDPVQKSDVQNLLSASFEVGQIAAFLGVSEPVLQEFIESELEVLEPTAENWVR